MNLSFTVFIQVIIIAVLISIGFILTKFRLIDDKGAKQMTNILLYAVTPCIIINSYRKEFDINTASKLLAAFAFSLLIHIIMIFISHVVFRPEKTNSYRVNIFAAVYSNCGFMAIPLLQATLGSEGVFYGSAYLAVFTVLYWTHGVFVYTNDKTKLAPKKALLTPGVIGIAIGMIVFVFSVRLPKVVTSTIEYMVGLNTPLSMIVLGTYLTELNLKETVKKTSMYIVCLLRLIIFPVITIYLAKLLNIDVNVGKALIITSACPVAAATTLFAAKYEMDTLYASELVSVSTILSIITIPSVLLLC